MMKLNAVDRVNMVFSTMNQILEYERTTRKRVLGK